LDFFNLFLIIFIKGAYIQYYNYIYKINKYFQNEIYIKKQKAQNIIN